MTTRCTIRDLETGGTASGILKEIGISNEVQLIKCTEIRTTCVHLKDIPDVQWNYICLQSNKWEVDWERLEPLNLTVYNFFYTVFIYSEYVWMKVVLKLAAWYKGYKCIITLTLHWLNCGPTETIINCVGIYQIKIAYTIFIACGHCNFLRFSSAEFKCLILHYISNVSLHHTVSQIL